MAASRHPITGQRLSQEQLDQLIDPATGDWDWSKLSPDDGSENWMSKDVFARTMREIRGSYARRLKGGWRDAVAFDFLVDEYELLWHDRQQALRFVTRALVVGSAKAKQINHKYFKGRYK